MTHIDGLDIAAAAGFPVTLNVHEDYVIRKGGVLSRRGKVIREYAPMAARELPSAIYSLQEWDNEGLLDFARRYGQLGWEALQDELDKTAVPIMERLEKGLLGDLVTWVWPHVRGIRLVMDGLRIIQEGDLQAGHRLLSALVVPADRWKSRETDLLREATRFLDEEMLARRPGARLLVAEVGILGNTLERQWLYGEEDDILAKVGEVVTDIISENIRKVHRRSYFDPEDGKIKSYLFFEALIEAVYWQILDTAGGGEFRTCKECGAPFICTDRRQRFCPPRFMEQESRCALRHRQRKWRKTKTEQEECEDGQA